MSDFEAILRWFLAITLVSYAVAPFAWWMGAGLGNAAAALTRPLGVVVVIVALWWPAAALGIPFTASGVVVTAVILGAISWTLWLRSSHRMSLTSIAVFETIWIVLFAGYALFRSYNPHIVNTEKPMEIAFLSSIVRTSSVPSPDPWFAGETINYYYFGYQIVGGLAKVSGVAPATAFNLALAMLFASVGTVAAAVGLAIAKKAGIVRLASQVAVAASSLFFMLLAGNLVGLQWLVNDSGAVRNTTWWYSGLGWQATRVITDTNVHGRPGERMLISEFPAFSFILGDLHPHVLTYPLLISLIAITVGFLLQRHSVTYPRMIAAGSLVGILYISNSWDAPLGMLLLMVAGLAAFGWRSRETWLRLVAAGAAALVTALPFMFHYTAPVGLARSELPAIIAAIPVVRTLASTFGIVVWRPSDPVELFLVHGQFILAGIGFVVLAAIKDPGLFRGSTTSHRIAGGVAAVALVVAVVWAPAVVILGAPLAAATIIAMRSSDVSWRIVGALFSVGFFLALVPEFIYIQDPFGDRMNTAFKLHFQAWALLALATAGMVALGLAPSAIRTRAATTALICGLVLVTAIYTPVSARDWTDGFRERHGQDGSAFLTRANPDDAAAIHWLDRNADDGAVIVEGPGCSYQNAAGTPMNRFSAFTGVPAVVGWAGHQGQWRRGETDPIWPRITARQEFSNDWLDGFTLTADQIPDATFIVLGAQERLGSESCDSLPTRDTRLSRIALELQGWRAAFESGETVIMVRPE